MPTSHHWTMYMQELDLSHSKLVKQHAGFSFGFFSADFWILRMWESKLAECCITLLVYVVVTFWRGGTTAAYCHLNQVGTWRKKEIVPLVQMGIWQWEWFLCFPGYNNYLKLFLSQMCVVSPPKTSIWSINQKCHYWCNVWI